MSSSASKTRVALIYGGRSGEHEISVRSAESVRAALDSSRYSVVDYFIDREGKWSPRAISPEPDANPGIDVAFPILHGTFGEDGTIQALLELAGIPYVGAGVLASAVAMDKAVTKRLCQAAGLPVVPYLVFTRGHFDPATIELPFDFPVFVKPANLGSSVGITKVKAHAQLASALETASRYDRKIVVERGIDGREFECAVLGGADAKASAPCEILPSEEFYTYDDKYILNKARIELPANLTPAQTSEMQALSLAAFHAVDCDAMARVDFLMERSTGQFFVNEINTIPGFTSISMYPKMWQYSGVSYPQLLDTLISLALKRADERRELQFSR